MKRAFDVVVSAAGLVMTSPILAVAAIAVKLDSPGPALYRGVRVGKDGAPFQILKLRTMRAAPTPQGPAVTAADDPRITPIGRFLRRSKIDELPQLLNVLKGDMSLVGPRPEDPVYVERYSEEQRRVLSVRPGITGPTALDFLDEEKLLSGRDSEALYVEQVMPKKLSADLRYVETASFGGDIRILGRTIVAVIQRMSRRGSA